MCWSFNGWPISQGLGSSDDIFPLPFLIPHPQCSQDYWVSSFAYISPELSSPVLFSPKQNMIKFHFLSTLARKAIPPAFYMLVPYSSPLHYLTLMFSFYAFCCIRVFSPEASESVILLLCYYCCVPDSLLFC